MIHSLTSDARENVLDKRPSNAVHLIGTSVVEEMNSPSNSSAKPKSETEKIGHVIQFQLNDNSLK